MSAREQAPNAVILDTHAAIWLADGRPMSGEARSAIEVAAREADSIVVSAITAWEISLLVQRGRIRISMSVRDWLTALLNLPGVSVGVLTPDILIESNELPGEPPRDPADRILIATARSLGLPLVTRDKRILDYARRGHVPTIRC